MEKILKFLGLKADATPEQVIAAITERVDQSRTAGRDEVIESLDSVTEILGLSKKATEKDVLAAVTALQKAVEKSKPSAFELKVVKRMQASPGLNRPQAEMAQRHQDEDDERRAKLANKNKK